MTARLPWITPPKNKPHTKSNTMKRVTKIAAFITISLCQLCIGYNIGRIATTKQINKELVEKGVKEYNCRTGLLQYVPVLGLYSSNTPEPATNIVPGIEALLPSHK